MFTIGKFTILKQLRETVYKDLQDSNHHFVDVQRKDVLLEFTKPKLFLVFDDW